MSDASAQRILKAVFAANVLATLLLWRRGSSPLWADGSLDGALIAAGRLAGLMAALLILTQLILVSRLPFIEHAFGFDRLNRIHRNVGLGLVIGILSHPVLLTLGYARSQGMTFVGQYQEFLKIWPGVALAALAMAIILVVGFLSAPFIRRKLKYETWHAAHLLMYVAVGLALTHQFNSEDVSSKPAVYYWLFINYATFGIILFWRFIWPFILYGRHRFRVERVVPETRNVTSIYITGRGMDRFSFEPGQYVHVMFLARGYLQPHPFSLSKAPDGRELRLSIKAVGDFTSLIKDLKPGTPVLLEGPFGRFAERAAVKGKYLMIAGGIGITPIRSMLEALCRKRADAILLYGNPTDADIALKTEIDAMPCRVHHVIKDHVDLAKIKAAAPDFKDRDIYLCGPPPMMEALIRVLLTAGVPKAQLHYEKFSY